MFLVSDCDDACSITYRLQHFFVRLVVPFFPHDCFVFFLCFFARGFWNESISLACVCAMQWICRSKLRCLVAVFCWFCLFIFRVSPCMCRHFFLFSSRHMQTFLGFVKTSLNCSVLVSSKILLWQVPLRCMYSILVLLFFLFFCLFFVLLVCCLFLLFY